jgi:hypothetical protein
VVRLALQQRDDSVELPVGEAELAMERLFGDRAQAVILSAARDVTSHPPAGGPGIVTAIV